MDKKEWGPYATLNTLIPLSLLILFNQPLDFSNLIMASVVALMTPSKGVSRPSELAAKTIFTVFLCLIRQDDLNTLLKRIFIFVASVYIIHMIPYMNFIHKAFIENKTLFCVYTGVVVFWFIWLGWRFYKEYLLKHK